MDADVVRSGGVQGTPGPEEGRERGFRPMPAAGKAAAVLIWFQTGLLVLFLTLGRSGAAPTEMTLPDDLALSLLAGAWTVLGGAFVFALSFALFWGKRWVQVALLVNYTLMVVRSSGSMTVEGWNGSGVRDLLLGAVMVSLLLTPGMRAWFRPRRSRHSHRR